MDKSIKEEWLHIAEFCYEIRAGGKTPKENRVISQRLEGTLDYNARYRSRFIHVEEGRQEDYVKD